MEIMFRSVCSYKKVSLLVCVSLYAFFLAPGQASPTSSSFWHIVNQPLSLHQGREEGSTPVWALHQVARSPQKASHHLDGNILPYIAFALLGKGFPLPL